MRQLGTLIFFTGLSAAFAGPCPASPQDAEERLRKEIERALPEADAFARQLQEAIEAANREAEAAKAYGQLNVDQFESSASAPDGGPDEVDILDELLRKQVPAFAATRQTRLERGPPLLVLVSLAMPDASLKTLLKDVSAAGGQLVLRGFLEGSVAATAARIAELIGEGGDARGFIVDPRLFRTFAVEAVPVFIVPAGPLVDCDAPGCTASAPPHDRISGNVTLRYALQRIAGEGEYAAHQARAYLERLEQVE